MEWGDFLLAMAGTRVNGAVGIVLSIAVEYWPWYAGLEAKASRLIFAALCFVIPILATGAAILTGEFGVLTDWAGTWWPAIVAGSAAAFAGTVAHTRKL